MIYRSLKLITFIATSLVLLAGCNDTTPASQQTETDQNNKNQETQYQAFTPQEVEQAKKMTAEYFARFEKGKVTTQAEMGKDILKNFRASLQEQYSDPNRFEEFLLPHIKEPGAVDFKLKPGVDPEIMDMRFRVPDFAPWWGKGDTNYIYTGLIPMYDKFEVLEFPDKINNKKSTLEVWSPDHKYWTEIVKGKSGLLFYSTSLISSEFEPLKRADNNGKKTHPNDGGDY